MPEPPLLLTFAVASIALILVPGPNLVYIVTQSMSRGVRAGLASAVGVEIGTLVYVLATALGVSGVKVGLFFLAFLPQFVATGPAAAPAATQLTVLGLVFLALAFVLDVAYAIAAGLAGSLIRTKGGEITWLRWPVVCIYVGLAAYAVVA